jgi:hypothetical protein
LFATHRTLVYTEKPRNISVRVKEIPHSPFFVENIQRVAETEENVPQIFLAAQEGPPVLILARAFG